MKTPNEFYICYADLKHYLKTYRSLSELKQRFANTGFVIIPITFYFWR